MPKAQPGCREQARGDGSWWIGLEAMGRFLLFQVDLIQVPLPSEVSGLYWCSSCALTAHPCGRERSTLV